jgi:hypothetical protein
MELEDEVNESSATLPRGWRYGIHPRAVGMQIRSLGRVDLPIGEALRLEMVRADQGEEDVIDVQYYICSEAGGWALWLSGARADVAARETTIHELTPALVDKS